MRVYEASLSYNLIQLGDDVTVNTPAKVVEYMRSGFEATPMAESFWVILLDRKNHALGRVRITLGTATAALAHPREVFRPAILANACAIICAHNHPSCDPAPSAADVQVTRQLRDAAKAVDIELIDHVIVGYPESDPLRVGHYSFREAGLL
jgi:DNA repair protein RadC